MRIIAGQWGGRRLVCPDGISTRPTLDRVKEAVFSSLMPYLAGACVLDLFAGSGALGLESLSRGASRAVLVDADREAIACITQNIETLDAENAAVIKSDALSYLSACRETFDLVFLDPPYESGLAVSCAAYLLSRGLLRSGSRVVVEWDDRMPFSAPLGFTLIKTKKYGKTFISYLEPEGECGQECK